MTNPAPPPPPQAEPALKVPPTLAIIGCILLCSALLAQLLPAGSFKREERQIAREGGKIVALKVEPNDTTATLARRAGAEPGALVRFKLAETGRVMLNPQPGAEVLVELPSTWRRTVVVPGSYAQIPRDSGTGLNRLAAAVGSVVLAPIKGFVDRADIIAFVLIIGGAFALIMATGAIDALLYAAVGALGRRKQGWLMIPLCMVLFSLCGALFGMSEEAIPFTMITIPLALRLGYDSITGLCMSFVAAGLGFAGALMNPFTIGIAQGIAELPIYSGFGFRLCVWVSITALGIVYAMVYARRVRLRPESSIAFETDKVLRRRFAVDDIPTHSLGLREISVLILLAITVVLAAYGVHAWDWYINEMCALFMVCGILAAFIGRLGLNRSCDLFIGGMRDLVGATMVIAIGRGILLVFQDAQSLDTLLHHVASVLKGTHSIVGVWLMFLVQTALNFFVNSGSAQASISMPLIAPLSDLIGVTRQTAVLAFQFGNGFMDMMIPTSAVTMTVLGIANLPYGRWLKWAIPLQILLLIYGAIVLAIAVSIGWQ